MDSNTSRPIPRANTGSRLLDWISDTSILLVQLERRIDPFFRPLFDAVLREPLARLTTCAYQLATQRRRPEDCRGAAAAQ
jgi:hypothetical protein